jgi:hypothetical protein
MSSLIKEISENNTSVTDSTRCIHKSILYSQEVMTSAISEKLLYPEEGHIQISVDPILQSSPKVS